VGSCFARGNSPGPKSNFRIRIFHATNEKEKFVSFGVKVGKDEQVFVLCMDHVRVL